MIFEQAAPWVPEKQKQHAKREPYTSRPGELLVDRPSLVLPSQRSNPHTISHVISERNVRSETESKGHRTGSGLLRRAASCSVEYAHSCAYVVLFCSNLPPRGCVATASCQGGNHSKKEGNSEKSLSRKRVR